MPGTLSGEPHGRHPRLSWWELVWMTALVSLVLLEMIVVFYGVLS